MAWSANFSSCRSLADVHAVVRLAERRIEDAVAFLAEAMTPGPVPLVEEPDQRALHLASESPAPLAEWARARGVSRQTAFRWFTQAYGVAPTRYRIEARAVAPGSASSPAAPRWSPSPPTWDFPTRRTSRERCGG
jgi:AraC-like DNA-binding protein